MMILGCSGCFLPFLIIINLLFGRLFFKTGIWLVIEGVLILLFFFTSIIMTRRMFTKPDRRKGVIDVEGEVIKERKRLKNV